MSYFPPALEEFNYLSHMILPVCEPHHPLKQEELAYNVAYFNKKDKPVDWMYDSYLSLLGKAPSGNAIYADVNRGTTASGDGDFYAILNPNPANKKDWEENLAAHLDKTGICTTLDNTVRDLKGKIGKNLPSLRNMVISIPYPHPHQSMFGRLKPNKPSLNFSTIAQNLMMASEQRLEACQWFVDLTIEQWKKQNYKNQHLLGFYWVYESIHYSWDIDDHWVIKELYKYIRMKGYKFFWIPFYSSFNVHILSDYQNFYFDCAFLQPNHMFYKSIKDVKKAALEAKARYAGIEMEYYIAKNIHNTLGSRHKRFRNYLNGGVKYKYMTESACAYFMGHNDVHKMARSKDKTERGLYDDLYHFVKGDYQIP